MGFGHRIYNNGDPRSPIIKEYSRLLSTNRGAHQNKTLYKISEHIDNRMQSEKKI